jgi:MFS family permease
MADRHRGKALGFMQSFWALGFILAAIVNWLVQDVFHLDWRSVFFVGVLPALLTLWVRSSVEELARGKGRASHRACRSRARSADRCWASSPLALMNACALFGYWGFNTWVPSFLRAAPEAGGIGLSNATMSRFAIVMYIGMWAGYLTYGVISDIVGRRRATSRSCSSRRARSWPTRPRRIPSPCSCSARSRRSLRPATSADSAR